MSSLFSSCDSRTLGFTAKHLIDVKRSRIFPLQMYLGFQEARFEADLFTLLWFTAFVVLLWLVSHGEPLGLRRHCRSWKCILPADVVSSKILFISWQAGLWQGFFFVTDFGKIK